MLRKSGLEVFEAASGSAAIDLLRTRGGEIELILPDLTIPGSSSLQVVKEAASVQPEMKVILTSAYAQESGYTDDKPPAGPASFASRSGARISCRPFEVLCPIAYS